MIIHGEELKGISKEQEEKLLSLKQLYAFWNSQINVISRKDIEQFDVHHLLHSLSIAQIFDFANNHEVMDLGCGGGFPGIPLAICFPNVHFHMVDSIGKKIKVVEEISKSLGLENVSAQHARAEDIKNRRFDCVISRAVAPLKDLLHWSIPLINRKNTHSYGLICLKGGDLSMEISHAGKRVHIWEIYQKIFQDSWFKEKFILQVKP